MSQQLRDQIRTVEDFPEPGISFKDITPVLANAHLLRLAVDELAAPWREANVTKVIGIESRGFILGAMLADELDAGFIPVRKAGKLPHDTVSQTYDLEYGTDSIEMHVDAIDASDYVLIHDDVIATGGTAAATDKLIESAGGGVLGYSFFIELTFLRGRERLNPDHTIHSLLQM